MKRLLLYPLIISLILLATTACESDPPVPTYDDVISPDDPDVGDESVVSLGAFSADSYPSENTWVIEDDWATTEDFAGLREAIIALSGSGRTISLEFPNLEFIPDYALFNDSDYETRAQSYAISALEAIVFISADRATSVGLNAFMYCANLQSVNLPNVISTQNYAFFGCSSLVSIDMPYAECIGEYAFASCTSLYRIECPNVSYVGEGGFADCSALYAVNFPLLSSAEKNLFWRCYDLTSVTIPSANTIGITSFAYCYDLTSITVATLSYMVIYLIESDSFSNTTTSNITLTIGSANSGYVSGNALTLGDFSAEFSEIIMVDGDGNVVEPDEPDEPDEPTTPDDGAHAIDLTCFGSASVAYDQTVVSDNITYIYNSTYYNSSYGNLTSLSGGYFYNTTELIGLSKICITDDYAYHNSTLYAGESLSSLVEVGYTQDGDIFTYELSDGAKFFYFANNTLYSAIADKIELYFDSLGSTVDVTPGFSDDDEPTDETAYVTFAELSATSYPATANIWYIEESSAELEDFYGLRDALYAADNEGREITLILANLEEIPYSATTSSEGAFYQCDALVAVHLTKATEVGTYAFYYCTNLASIYMPEVTRIWSFAFGHCESLTHIEFANLTTVFTWAFENCSTLTTVNMPKVTWLDAGAFAHCQKLTDVSITTSENCKLEGFGSSNYSAFYNAFSSSNITLTIGSANSEYISGNTLTLDGASATFKEIIFVDNYDEAVGDTGDAPDLGYEELF